MRQSSTNSFLSSPSLAAAPLWQNRSGEKKKKRKSYACSVAIETFINAAQKGELLLQPVVSCSTAKRRASGRADHIWFSTKRNTTHTPTQAEHLSRKPNFCYRQ